MNNLNNSPENESSGMMGDEGGHMDSTGATIDARIARTLEEVSSWTPDAGLAGDASAPETTPLWKYALASLDAHTKEESGHDRGILARMAQPIPQRKLAIAAGVMLLVTGVLVVTMPQLGRARMGRAPAPEAPSMQVESLRAEPGRLRVPLEKRIDGYKGDQNEAVLGHAVTMLGERVSAGIGIDRDDRAPADVGSMSRQVARNGSITLEADDVGSVAARVAALTSNLHTEYVERSTLHGEGTNTQAEIVLRIAAARLDEVLGSIRAMGTVTAESVAAEDVTAQVVDIEARLHNERRVEIELLDLLDKRTDAPLREVLDLRDKLREVRSEIERMQAARDRLSRLVSLSTLTVSISATPEEPKDDPAESSFFKPLTEAVAASWHDGLSGLTGSVAWLVRVAVGGLLWWALIVGSIIVWRRLGHVKHLPA